MKWKLVLLTIRQSKALKFHHYSGLLVYKNFFINSFFRSSSKIIGQYPLQYVANKQTNSTLNACEKSIVILIKSARNMINRRLQLRQYLTSSWLTLNFQVYFLLGKREDDLGNRLVEELSLHGDLIIGDFDDNYENLVIKSFLGYQFFKSNCDKASHLLMADDDTLLDLDKIILLAQSKKSEMLCLKGRPIVDRGSNLKRYYGKYWFWIDQIPPNYRVPTHCNGQCYLLSRNNAHRIYQMATVTNRHDFRIEGLFSFQNSVLSHRLSEKCGNKIEKKIFHLKLKYIRPIHFLDRI